MDALSIGATAQVVSDAGRRVGWRWSAARDPAGCEKAPCWVPGPAAACHRSSRMNAVLTLPNQRPRLFLLVAAALWFIAFQALTSVSDGCPRYRPGSQQPFRRCASILLLRRPEGAAAARRRRVRHGHGQFLLHARTERALLAGRAEGGQRAGGLARRRTPFCSCSAVPLFIGFVQAGVPLGLRSRS